RGVVDSLLGRLAEFVPPQCEDTGLVSDAPSATDVNTAAEPARKDSKKAAPTSAATKSVRIALERLDRMMNTVGELVINRTQLVGRLAELEKLVDMMTFSKERLQGKIAEFQDKYEFNRLNSPRLAAPWAPKDAGERLSSAAAGESSLWSDFSELEMDR